MTCQLFKTEISLCIILKSTEGHHLIYIAATLETLRYAQNTKWHEPTKHKITVMKFIRK